MSTAYPWPTLDGWMPNQWEMRIVPNTMTFTSPLNRSTQAVELPGERWRVIMGLPPGVDERTGGLLEAYFDRLRGPVNLITLGNLKRPVPLGTMRNGGALAWKNASNAAMGWTNSLGAAMAWSVGPTVLRYPIAQLGNVAYIQASPGMYLYAGDMLGINGQLVRVMADTAAAGSDGIVIAEFGPRARAAMPAYSSVAWNYPTATFRLAADGVPVAWRPGAYDGATLELIEAL